MSERLEDELQDVFRQVFNRKQLELRPEMTASDVPGWDSLKHIELIVAVEARFKVRFKAAEVGALQNVADLLAALRAKLGG